MFFVRKIEFQKIPAENEALNSGRVRGRGGRERGNVGGVRGRGGREEREMPAVEGRAAVRGRGGRERGNAGVCAAVMAVRDAPMQPRAKALPVLRDNAQASAAKG